MTEYIIIPSDKIRCTRDRGSSVNLLMGPSGIGKSTVIKHLLEINPLDYVYPRIYTTRPLREAKDDKVPVTSEELEGLRKTDDLVVNDLYTVKYALSRTELRGYLKNRISPLIDWSLEAASYFSDEDYPVRKIYLAPKSIQEWITRATNAGRIGERIENGRRELEALYGRNFVHSDIDFVVVNSENESKQVAVSIHKFFSLMSA